ncbi:MAG: T9SS type A sorting domain-containing protein [Ignavibacteriaceae bacterium]|nr:T9SS type A sorting domain-containing protein [Ignavibacteriaceae bacterium]
MLKNSFSVISKISFLALIIVTLIAESAFPQSPDTLWTKTFGGSNIDVGYAVQETRDGGYIISGYTRSFGTVSGRNVWLIKTDIMGNLQWHNTFGGNADDEAYAVQQTADGGYIIAGYTKSFGSGLMDAYLIKADSLGNFVWERMFGGAQDDEAYGVLQASDGGYIIAGATSSFGAGSRDAFLIKTDANGTELWRKTFGGLSSDGARNVQKTSDGGFILSGWTFSLGPAAVGNAVLYKADSLGNQQWAKAYGGTDVDRGLYVQQTSDGGYIFTGYTASVGAGNDDAWVVKTDNLGNEAWSKTFGGTVRDYGNSIALTPDGGCIITGYTISFGAGGDDLWMIKLNSTGTEEWRKLLGGTASDVGYDIKVTRDGSYVVTGHTLSYGAGVHDVWLIKTGSVIPVELLRFTGAVINNSINLRWSTASEINNKEFEIQRSVSGAACNSAEAWQTAGFIPGSGTTTETQDYTFSDNELIPGTYRYRLIQKDFDGSEHIFYLAEALEVTAVAGFSLSQNYPNPFSKSTLISYHVPPGKNREAEFVTLKVKNILGEDVATLVNEAKSPGRHEAVFDAAGLPAGIYFCEMSAGEYKAVKKLIKIK